jgi:sensor domain CHASE-containing protein
MRRTPTRILMGAFLVAILFAGVVLLVAVNRNNETAASAQDLAAKIQEQRVRNIRDGCEETNRRHDDVERVISLLVRRPVTPQHLTPAQREQQRKNTALFVQALVPKRNCDKLVKEQAGSQTVRPSG